MTALGAMRGTMEGLHYELREVSLEAFREAFSQPFIKYSKKDCFIWLPNFLKFNCPESPNVVKSWVGAWDSLPECSLKNELFLQLKDYTEGLSEGFAKAFLKTIGKTMPNQEQEQEQEQDLKKLYKEKNNQPMFNQKDFDVFYSAYPNHNGKKDALARWKKLVKSKELPELSVLLSAIKTQLSWRKNANGDFRPEWKHPATWLNKGCWEDEVGSEPDKPKQYNPTIEELVS